MASPVGQEIIFTVEEAADFARVTPATIRRWFDEGLKHFPTAKNSSRTGPRGDIIRLSALIAFVEANEVGALATSPESAKAGNRSSKGPGKSAPRRASGKVNPGDWVAGGH